ncbi:glycosyltransferase family 8 protein [Mucilaginibacter ginkgonis]|uniref:Glycosyltransferase family 8 protein n=1 Tax=Mucilaginibacter ginkgonis TaxID=2682091 RepID=A0A6I4HV53_9SPHI|nr:glycosyltransferase family 8 protein [Mucilaginibacter ginkgonis]QQL50197.1 glycosyltransferase family 8 protein [Mucilaginibacter ginkgonis]
MSVEVEAHLGLNGVRANVKELHIALGFDKNYMVFIYPMLASVFENNRGEKLVFHAIVNGIDDADRTALHDYITLHSAEILFYKLNNEALSKKLIFPVGTHFNIATYYRLFFPSLVRSRTRRLLYLDVDLVVLGNLRQFYEKDIGEHAVAAISDSFVKKCERLGVMNEDGYFNAGVMLIDLDNWEKQCISEKALSFIEDYPEKIKFCDQDALNAVLANNWLKLSNKYNFTQFFVELQIPSKILVKDVLIVHFTSANKPWNALARNKLRYLYQHYLSLSPKRNVKRYVDFKWNLRFIRTYLRIRIKEFYFDHKIDKVIPFKNWKKSPWDY